MAADFRRIAAPHGQVQRLLRRAEFGEYGVIPVSVNRMTHSIGRFDRPGAVSALYERTRVPMGGRKCTATTAACNRLPGRKVGRSPLGPRTENSSPRIAGQVDAQCETGVPVARTVGGRCTVSAAALAVGTEMTDSVRTSPVSRAPSQCAAGTIAEACISRIRAKNTDAGNLSMTKN